MLKFRLELHGSGLHEPWRPVTAGQGWVNGRSWIAPFDNPALEHHLAESGGVTTVVVRERIHGQPCLSELNPELPDPEQRRAAHLVAQTRAWPGEFVLLQIRDAVVTVEAGRWGSAPLYLSVDDALVGSWDLTDHRRQIAAAGVDEQAAIDLLVMRSRYSSRTLFRGVYRLTERACATWSPGRAMVIDYPRSAVHYLPRELRPEAHVLRSYDSLLSAAVARRNLRAADVAVELSGGTDSATVALTVGAMFGERAVHSYGLLVGGDAGPQQRWRRIMIAALAGLSDLAVDATEHPPLAPPVNAQLFSPEEEPYREALEAVLDRESRQVVLTGIGGDELFALRPDELTEQLDGFTPPEFLTPRARELAQASPRCADDTPVTVIPETALLACLVRSPIFLRAGKWPVSPLCDPELVTFGEWMPRTWREGKRLPRAWLLARGVPRAAVWPQLRENFVPVMQRGLHCHGITQLRDMAEEGAMVVDLGLVDPDALHQQAVAARRAATVGAPLDPGLFPVLALERGLRTLLA